MIAPPKDFHDNVLGRAAFFAFTQWGEAWSSFMNLMYFEDLNVGDSWTSSECPVDHEEMLTYGRAYDPWPFHVNPEAAAKSPFGGLIASGGYTISLMYRLFHEIVNQPIVSSFGMRGSQDRENGQGTQRPRDEVISGWLHSP